jgi:hypothetical protein
VLTGQTLGDIPRIGRAGMVLLTQAIELLRRCDANALQGFVPLLLRESGEAADSGAFGAFARTSRTDFSRGSAHVPVQPDGRKAPTPKSQGLCLIDVASCRRPCKPRRRLR